MPYAGLQSALAPVRGGQLTPANTTTLMASKLEHARNHTRQPFHMTRRGQNVSG
jgi:hypothetical protein